MFYPTGNAWPNVYQINGGQTQSIPIVYYPTATTEPLIHQPTQTLLSTTTTKSVTTRILDPTTLPTISTNPIAEETQPNQTVEPANLSQVTTTINVPNSNNSVRPASATSSFSGKSSSTQSVSPPAAVTTVQPPPLIHPFIPKRRVIHQAHRLRTPSGYFSSDLDYTKRKVYKTDYKYRHYYCCNYCRGRWDLHNRFYSCCEWFYGCPLWAYLLLALFFLALLITFLTLFGLQPAVNAERRSQTAQTRLLNRTQIIYGFYLNCGYQVNATYVPTTLVLCTNTPTTTTARIELSSYYTIINGSKSTFSYHRWLLFILFFIVL